MSPSRRDDRVELMLKRADAKLEEWFRSSQKATRRASLTFAEFLRGAKRNSAGALRHEVEDLQEGLKKLSSRLDRVEHETSAAPKTTSAPKTGRARPAAATKTNSSRKATSTRRRKKAA
jgi:hypothetical protein